MKKNGFTLLEMIAVITIIGILLIVVTPQIGKLIMGNQKDTYISFVKTVRDATYAYADIELGDNSDVDEISISELMKSGYIKTLPNGVDENTLKGKKISFSKKEGIINIDDIELEFMEISTSKIYKCNKNECSVTG